MNKIMSYSELKNNPTTEHLICNVNNSLSTPCIAHFISEEGPTYGVIQVRDDSMIQQLWKTGAYGIGTLSRTKPTWWARTVTRLNPATSIKKTNYVEDLSQLRKLNRLDSQIQVQHSALLLEQWNQLQLNQEFIPTLEVLNLLPEEVFYLISENRLNLYKPDDTDPISLLTLLKIWDYQPEFLGRVIAYTFFRNQGWIPKSGMKFGVDLVLYHKPPQFVHSKYAVALQVIESKEFKHSLLPLPYFKAGPTAWLKTIERVVSHAKKVR
ncbi:tRNA splicing endonuclease subunit sen2 [Coelomomyces lativittatus]|nr:tRNA splicing endonuclease subunit sen2 [Coelomomyces lativittatus]